MLEEKKLSDFEALVGSWVGEVGTLNAAVEKLPIAIEAAFSDTKKSVNDFVASVPVAIENAEGLLAQYEARGQKLYLELLDVHAKIETAKGEIQKAGESGAEKTNAQINEVLRQTGLALEAMFTLRQSVDGDHGLSAKTNNVARTLDEKVGQLVMAVNALRNIEASKLSEHALAISSLKTGLVVAVAFCAGSMVSSNPWLSVIGIGVLAVGVAFGWCLSWAFAKIHQQ